MLSGWKLSSFGPKDETLLACASGSPYSVPLLVEGYLYKSSPLSLRYPKRFVKCNKILKSLLSLALICFISWTFLYC